MILTETKNHTIVYPFIRLCFFVQSAMAQKTLAEKVKLLNFCSILHENGLKVLL